MCFCLLIISGVMNVSKGDHETIKDLALFADIGLAIRLGASGPHRQAFGSYILEDGVAECCSSLQLVVNAMKIRSVFNNDVQLLSRCQGWS